LVKCFLGRLSSDKSGIPISEEVDGLGKVRKLVNELPIVIGQSYKSLYPFEELQGRVIKDG
jgi:hypothetical protein